MEKTVNSLGYHSKMASLRDYILKAVKHARKRELVRDGSEGGFVVYNNAEEDNDTDYDNDSISEEEWIREESDVNDSEEDLDNDQPSREVVNISDDNEASMSSATKPNAREVIYLSDDDDKDTDRGAPSFSNNERKTKSVTFA